MPLFDSLEREVSSFFVAQGSVFDTLVKTLLDRIAHIETRVDQNNLTLAKSIHDGGVNIGDFGSGESSGSSSNDEMEYFVMTLARQLNVVLALIFRPYASDSVPETQARQQQLASISDVLTDNEAILMGFTAVTLPEEPTGSGSPHPHNDGALPHAEATSATTDASEPQGNEKETKQLSDQASSSTEANSAAPQHEVVQVKSTFAMIHHLHQAEEQRQKQEKELLDRMKKLLYESQNACHSQCKALHGQNDDLLRKLQLQNEKLSSEWTYQQQQHASTGLAQAQFQDQQQKELDRQLLAFSNTFLASQSIQEQQISRILENLREFSDRFLSKSDLDQLSAMWLQTARADCVYGANQDTLVQLQSDLLQLQQMLDGEPASPAVAQLQAEVRRVLELLQRLLELLDEDPELLQSPNGAQMMQSLRAMMSQLEELAHNAFKDQKSTAFLTTSTRQMELGTASLLEVIETQQERYQQTLSQQQAELELLKLDLQTQKMSDEELRRQLGACPSQEDTMRLINALKEQLQASTSDSASQMLGTLDDLRGKLTGLPTFEFLEDLLQSKADRSEIDRLRLLLASNIPNGPGTPSLAKSPTRCLSCDQSLPFMHSRPGSAQPTHHQHDQFEHSTNSNQGSGASRPTSGSTRPMSASSRPSSRPSSRSGSPTRQGVPVYDHEQTLQQPTSVGHHNGDDSHANHNSYVSPFTRAMLLLSDHGGVPSTHDILQDLAASIDATKRRRQRMQDQQLLLAASADERASSTKRRTIALGSSLAEPNKNRIPLRRTTLSDQVVYGPSISSGLIKPKRSIAVSIGTVLKGSLGSARRDSSDESKTNRPKTAVTTERKGGGDLIVRAPTTTVVIRPFSEAAGKDEVVASSRRGTRKAQ